MPTQWATTHLYLLENQRPDLERHLIHHRDQCDLPGVQSGSGTGTWARRVLSAAAPLPFPSAWEPMLGTTLAVLKTRGLLPTLGTQACPAGQTILAMPNHLSSPISTPKLCLARREQEESKTQSGARVWGLPCFSLIFLNSSSLNGELHVLSFVHNKLSSPYVIVSNGKGTN